VDRLGRWVINAGGVAIIASVLGILAFILAEVWPLFEAPTVGPAEELSWTADGLGAVLVDEHRTHVAALDLDGRIRVMRLDGGALVIDRLLEAPAGAGAGGPAPAASDAAAEGRELRLTGVMASPSEMTLSASTRDGRVVALPVEWRLTFTDDRREVTPGIGEPIWFEMDPGGRAPAAFSVRMADDGEASAAAVFEDGTIRLVTRSVSENFLTGEMTPSYATRELHSPRRLSHLLLDAARVNLYGATGSGEILWWRLSSSGSVAPLIVSAGVRPITAVVLLIGDRALVVGQEDGSLSVWFPVRDEAGYFTLERIRDFNAHGGPIRLLAPSTRNKAFVAQDDAGTLGLYYSTSHRVLWRGRSPMPGATAVAFSPKADGLVLASSSVLADVRISARHPETGLRALFGRIWYEGYPKPEVVWQSSGGTDDFEPKLSLTPLAVGTLKGTIYSLILAVPLGVLGAMYTSQFMHAGLRRYVKPAVEIMAALPSVVIGFIAGLWLAPRIEHLMPALMVMMIVVPLAVVVSGLVWDRSLKPLARRIPAGSEVGMLMVVATVAVWLSIAMGPSLEAAAFGGDFQHWLRETTGLQYDQRNAIVVGLAMGFAVIPIIFAISEESFSNVPRSLISGSLALGADRWQSVTRVVLPMASPGIFSAIMIGFGRAVGETMIVLMATGNTPLMDWSPFNGFRTLSANIAVEIPEAPRGDTLYRTLFLAALLLFITTFVMNTVAELVRARLRRKYSQL
jgi:phosphate transport system permease protein